METIEWNDREKLILCSSLQKYGIDYIDNPDLMQTLIQTNRNRPSYYFNVENRVKIFKEIQSEYGSYENDSNIDKFVRILQEKRLNQLLESLERNFYEIKKIKSSKKHTGAETNNKISKTINSNKESNENIDTVDHDVNIIDNENNDDVNNHSKSSAPEETLEVELIASAENDDSKSNDAAKFTLENNFENGDSVESSNIQSKQNEKVIDCGKIDHIVASIENNDVENDEFESNKNTEVQPIENEIVKAPFDKKLSESNDEQKANALEFVQDDPKVEPSTDKTIKSDQNQKQIGSVIENDLNQSVVEKASITNENNEQKLINNDELNKPKQPKTTSVPTRRMTRSLSRQQSIQNENFDDHTKANIDGSNSFFKATRIIMKDNNSSATKAKSQPTNEIKKTPSKSIIKFNMTTRSASKKQSVIEADEKTLLNTIEWIEKQTLFKAKSLRQHLDLITADIKSKKITTIIKLKHSIYSFIFEKCIEIFHKQNDNLIFQMKLGKFISDFEEFLSK